MSPEYEVSWEHLSGEERREKIAAHISAMRIGHRVLEESHAQQEAIQDFEARSYQLDAFNSLWTARRNGADRGLIHLATGLGKTSVAVVDYAAFRQEQPEQIGQEPRALFVVHQNNILQQASERFAELLPEASRSFYSNRNKNLPESDVTFASFQALANGVHRFPDDYFDYIIYDEAHHIEARTYKKVVEHFKPTFQLGLTATPERMDEKDITDHFGAALYTKTLPEAIAEKHLATVNYNIISDGAVKEAMQNGFEPSSLAEIQRLFEVQPRNEAIVEKIRDTQDLIRHQQNVEHVKTIVFCADLEHADAIAGMMDGESYHSGKDEKQQAVLLDAFRNNRLGTITVRDMFNEGVDIPDARLIVFLRTTQSATIFEQQLGRGLRKNKDKQEVTVLDFVANIERITLIRELLKNIDTARTSRSNTTKGGSRNDEGTISEPGGDIKVHSDDSEFIFSQEIIDLLEKYNLLVEKNGQRQNWSEWSDSQLIELATKINSDTPLTAPQMEKLSTDNKFPNPKVIYERFGNLLNFHEQCGFTVWRNHSKEQIIELAQQLSPDTPMLAVDIKQLAKNNEFPSISLIYSLFGDLKQFQNETWQTGYIDWRTWSNEELVQLALELSPDTALGTNDLNALSRERKFPSLPLVTERFGGTREFQIACGFTVREDWKKYSDEEIASIIRSYSPDKPVTHSRINELSKEGLIPSSQTLTNRYGSFSALLEACGWIIKEKIDWSAMSDKDLALLAIEISPDKNLTSSQVIALSKEGEFISNSTLFKRFGSLKSFNALCDSLRDSKSQQ